MTRVNCSQSLFIISDFEQKSEWAKERMSKRGNEQKSEWPQILMFHVKMLLIFFLHFTLWGKLFGLYLDLADFSYRYLPYPLLTLQKVGLTWGESKLHSVSLERYKMCSKCASLWEDILEYTVYTVQCIQYVYIYIGWWLEGNIPLGQSFYRKILNSWVTKLYIYSQGWGMRFYSSL